MYNICIMDLPLSSFVFQFFSLTTHAVDSRQRDVASLWLLPVFSVVTGLIVEILLVLFFICNAV